MPYMVGSVEELRKKGEARTNLEGNDSFPQLPVGGRGLALWAPTGLAVLESTLG